MLRNIIRDTYAISGVHLSRFTLAFALFTTITIVNALNKFWSIEIFEIILTPIATMGLYSISLMIILLPWCGKNVRGAVTMIFGICVAGVMTWGFWIV